MFLLILAALIDCTIFEKEYADNAYETLKAPYNRGSIALEANCGIIFVQTPTKMAIIPDNSVGYLSITRAHQYNTFVVITKTMFYFEFEGECSFSVFKIDINHDRKYVYEPFNMDLKFPFLDSVTQFDAYLYKGHPFSATIEGQIVSGSFEIIYDTPTEKGRRQTLFGTTKFSNNNMINGFQLIPSADAHINQKGLTIEITSKTPLVPTTQTALSLEFEKGKFLTNSIAGYGFEDMATITNLNQLGRNVGLYSKRIDSSQLSPGIQISCSVDFNDSKIVNIEKKFQDVFDFNPFKLSLYVSVPGKCRNSLIRTYDVGVYDAPIITLTDDDVLSYCKASDDDDDDGSDCENSNTIFFIASIIEGVIIICLLIAVIILAVKKKKSKDMRSQSSINSQLID